MKKIKFLTTALLFFTAINLSSCDNEPIDPSINFDTPITNPTNGTFKVDFDGQTYVANEVIAIKDVQTQLGQTTTSYSIAGNLVNGTNGKVITIQFFENISNTYPTGIQSTISYIPSVLDPNSIYISLNPADPFTNTGQINVTTNDASLQTISGTFNCSVYLTDENQNVTGSKVFTNGSFSNIHYTIQ